MFFPTSEKQAWFSKQCLLIAFFLFFSFNHLALTKYHFVLGQASFYFITLALFTSHFSIPRRSLIFLFVFLAYCFGSAIFLCYGAERICSSRPYTAAISICFVFLFVQYVAYLVQHNLTFDVSIEKYLVYGAWALVIFALPDILILAGGGLISEFPFGFSELHFLALTPNSLTRLRGFTQEASYFGLVISTIYPILFIRLNERFKIPGLILVACLWTCLLFSGSRVGIITCSISTFLILFIWPRRLLCLLGALIAMALTWIVFTGMSYGDLLNSSHGISFDPNSRSGGSNLVRAAHIMASIGSWLENPFLGVGLGQLGYVLPQYYPIWYPPSSPEYELWASKASFGGVPSLSFLPKLLAEIGLGGVGILTLWVAPLLHHLFKLNKENVQVRKYSFAYLGFLISSFGVEGYLYLPAWLIFGVLIGMHRRSKG
jgi:hypothetical protein